MRSNSSGIYHREAHNLQQVFWYLISDIAMVPHIDTLALCLVLPIQQPRSLRHHIHPVVALHSDTFPELI